MSGLLAYAPSPMARHRRGRAQMQVIRFEREVLLRQAMNLGRPGA